MPTNEERREVAARLRDIDVKTWHTSWHELYAIKNACGCYTGQDQQDVELKDRLADLIEPEERTCRIKQHRCTNCDHEINDRAYFAKVVLDDGCWTAESRTANFCPHCGARVMQDAD